MLAKEGLLFIDPLTEQPFKHLMSRAAWPYDSIALDEDAKVKLQECHSLWKRVRKEILDEARKEALAKSK
jgi:hypothetical protein